MTNTDVQNLLINTLSTYGYFVLIILTSVIGLGVAYLIFDFGWRTIIKGQSSYISSQIMFLDHAPFTKPYAGYKRYRSKTWNFNHQE